MSTVSDVNTLSKMDVQAIRQCDKICLFHENGVGQVKLIKELKDYGPFDEREKSYMIDVSSRVHKWDDSIKHNVTASATCHELIYNWSASPSTWDAVQAICREGDELRLEWQADAVNGYFREAASRTPIHYDTLDLLIYRKGTYIASVRLSDSHCPDNTARMIRGI